MPWPLLEEVFKTSGVPSHTFVAPQEYGDLVLNLRTPGRGLVIEGPSGIGKTTAVEKALESLGLATSVLKLSARRPTDIEIIDALPTLGAAGIVIVDDFHKLSVATRSTLADYMKILADEESRTTKVIVIGINMAGHNLITFAHDLVNRIDVIPFESNPDDKVAELVALGSTALDIDLNVADEIVQAAQGSFYLAQMLSRETCKRAGILERSSTRISADVSFEAVKANVWDRLAQVFRERCKVFCRGTKMKRAGRAPYLQILRWLAEGSGWTLRLRDAMRAHPQMRGSVGQVVDKNYLRDLVRNNPDISGVLHYDESAEQLTVEDPQFIFFIRNIPWRSFTEEVGFTEVEFAHRYDFALSFAGEDRQIAEMLFEHLQDAEVEVFYDRNEQHRILANDVEEYLRPIYQSEARYLIVLLSTHYPRKIWTKFESDAFKARLGANSVIPVWFSDALPGIFDETRLVGGLTYDRNQLLSPQTRMIADLLLRRLEET
ncbi:MAG: TIR domain-containing protein [Nannocystaceae bacterium]